MCCNCLSPKEAGYLILIVSFWMVQLPKSCLKSQTFQEECLLSAIEQLSVHFSQWSYHISFPDLATIPLIHLKKFHESTNTESLRRMVKRMIDQVLAYSLSFLGAHFTLIFFCDNQKIVT